MALAEVPGRLPSTQLQEPQAHKAGASQAQLLQCTVASKALQTALARAPLCDSVRDSPRRTPL